MSKAANSGETSHVEASNDGGCETRSEIGDLDEQQSTGNSPWVLKNVQIEQNEELTGMFSNASRLRNAKFAAKKRLLGLNL